jgi:hypothetical protein
MAPKTLRTPSSRFSAGSPRPSRSTWNAAAPRNSPWNWPCPDDEFRTGVAHELRTLLSVITMTTSTLKEELDDLSAEQQRQYLHTPSPATLNASPRWPRTYST